MAGNESSDRSNEWQTSGWYNHPLRFQRLQVGLPGGCALLALWEWYGKSYEESGVGV